MRDYYTIIKPNGEHLDYDCPCNSELLISGNVTYIFGVKEDCDQLYKQNLVSAGSGFAVILKHTK